MGRALPFCEAPRQPRDIMPRDITFVPPARTELKGGNDPLALSAIYKID